MSIRRLSGVIAIIALSRLFLGGVSASCALVTESANGHAHGASAVDVDAPRHDERPSCEFGGAADCRTTHDDSCVTMSSCANALPSERCDARPRVSSHVPTAFVAELWLEPSRVPEPPPPRI